MDYDPSYPKNPSTLAEHIRKSRKDKGLTIRKLACKIGVHKFTLVKWEGGRIPRYKGKMRKLTEAVAEAGKFL